VPYPTAERFVERRAFLGVLLQVALGPFHPDSVSLFF
jgi:hypothetical protein